MKSVVFIACLLLSVAPLQAAPTAVTPVDKPSIDPQRLALSRKLAMSIVAPGTMERAVKMMMGDMQTRMFASMFDMKASDVGATGKNKDKTLRESIAEKDPNFEERFRISQKVMGEEMGPIMGRMEPKMREGMAKAYARRFTLAELTEIESFFGTPAGSSFARQSYEMMMDPDIMIEMATMVPDLMKEMPAIMAKVKKATAHLPLPPSEKKSGDDGAAGDAALPSS